MSYSPNGYLSTAFPKVLPTAKCRMVSATGASQMSHIGLGHLDVFSMVEVYWVDGGVERRGDE